MLKSTFFCFAKAVCWKFFVFCSLSFELFMIHSSPFVTWDSMGIFKVYWFVKLPGVLAVWVGWTIRCQNLVAIQRSKTKVPATLYTCSTGHTVDIYFLESTVGLRVPHLVRSLMRTTSEPSKTRKSVSQDSRLTRQPAVAQVVRWCLSGVGDNGQAPRKEVVRISRAGRLFARRLKLMIRAMKSRNRSLDPQIDNSLQETVGPIIFLYRAVYIKTTII